MKLPDGAKEILDFEIIKTPVKAVSRVIKGGLTIGQINTMMATGVKVGHPQTLPGPVPDEPTLIPDSGAWYQCLIYNIERDQFLCWCRNGVLDDEVIWLATLEISDRTLILPTVHNVQEFELKRANKKNNIGNMGRIVYDYLEERDLWGRAIFVPLLCGEAVNGAFEGLTGKLDFIHGFKI